MQAALEWTDDGDLTVGSVSYRCGLGKEPSPDQMILLKRRPLIQSYVELIAELAPTRILELGIFHGGSTVLLTQLAQPERLVALDIAEGCPALEQRLDSLDLREIVRPHYGVDQSDRASLRGIVASEFGGSQIDLVIDDASHLFDPTRVSFEVLFPHVRPGGAYVIEDWSWPHNPRAHPDPAYRGVTPLSAFALELGLVAASQPDVICEVVLRRSSAIVHRGAGDLGPSFQVADCLDRVGREMVEGLRQASTLQGQDQR